MNPIIDKISWHMGYKDEIQIIEYNEKYLDSDYDSEYEYNPDCHPKGSIDNNSVDSCTFRSITKDEWDIVLHPSDNWIIKMIFDERCFPREDYDTFEDKIRKKHGFYKNKTSYQSMSLKISRLEYFDKNTTLKEFVERIKERPAYGYFEGLKETRPQTPADIGFTKRKKYKKMYIMSWGT